MTVKGNILGQSGGGTRINGIIEEYQVASGGNVSAGDFVKFVNEVNNTELQFVNIKSYAISAVLLNENKVFITHSQNTSSYYLYGIVCTISGNTITTGTYTQLSDVKYSGQNFSTIKLSENKVFIAHSRGNYYYLYGMICTINGNTITAGTDTLLSSETYCSYEAISTILLNKNKVFISYGVQGQLQGMICTINDNTITAGIATQLSVGYKGNVISTIKLSENKVFIAHGYSDNYYLYGMICTINDNTITAGTDTQLSGYYGGYIISAVALSENKVFIAHGYSDNYYLYGMICTINDNTITAGTDTQLSDNTFSGKVFSVVTLKENKVIIVYCFSDTNTNLYKMECAINGTTININTNVPIINSDSELIYDYKISMIKLNGGKLFIVNNCTNIYSLYATTILTTVNKGNKEFFGVSKTNGTSGQTVQVYVPSGD